MRVLDRYQTELHEAAQQAREDRLESYARVADPGPFDEPRFTYRHVRNEADVVIGVVWSDWLTGESTAVPYTIEGAVEARAWREGQEERS